HYRLCPACARWRQARAVARLLPALWALQRRYPRARWVLITLTVLSTHEPLKTIVSRVQGRFAKLRRSKDWNGHILGGVGSMEITYHAGTGWHVHLHVLVACQERWAQADLAVAWRRASEGAGRVVDIRDRNQDIRSGRGAALCSLFKPPTLRGWGPAQVAEFDALARFKLGECYGALRGLRGALGKDGAESRAGAREAPRPKVGAPCPACGRPLAWARASQAEVQAMMWVTARPISLTRMLPGTMPSLDQGLVRASGNTPAMSHGDSAATPVNARALQDAWIGFLQRWPWQWFCTLTFRDLVHPEAAARQFRLFEAMINRALYGPRWHKHGQGIRWVRVLEYQQRGVIHFHALLAGVGGLRPLVWADRWHKLAGFAKIEPITHQAAVVRYVSKYVRRGDELELGGLRRRPPRPPRP
ncbi:MAG TPA: protein rep, partial [Candidatus Binatia bacterium]|nr:protein rep [Candidatus Binatia bacterium]